jgi:tRNA threonylcarbamoyladenosine biosynthesis protein TsaB
MHHSSLDLDYPALVVDGSGSHCFAGVIVSGCRWGAQITANEAPLESLFETVENVLSASGVELAALRSYVYCAGPGSVLGLRLCAMALETWSRLNLAPTRYYGYNSLELTATQLVHEGKISKHALLISDWKKDAWNGVRITDQQVAPVEAIPTEEIETWQGALFHLPARKGWQKAPDRAQVVRYRPEALPELARSADLANLLKPSSGIKLYSAGANTFQKWTPERHRSNEPRSTNP